MVQLLVLVFAAHFAQRLAAAHLAMVVPDTSGRNAIGD